MDDIKKTQEQVMARVEREQAKGVSPGAGVQNGDSDNGGLACGGEQNIENESPAGCGDEITPEFLVECFYLNHLGDAMVFMKLHKNNFLYNKSSASWLYWTGHHWDVDVMDYMRVAVNDVANVYEQEAWRINNEELKELPKDDPKRGGLSKLVNKLNGRAFALRGDRREKVLNYAHTLRDPMAIRGDEIDQSPWKLPVKNGVINLRSGDLEPGRRKDYLLRASPVEWRGIDEPCPAWERALSEMFSGNEVLQLFVQKIFGQALIGENLRSMLVVLSGIGRNGKSTIIEIISEIMGRLSGPIRAEMLLDQRRTMSSSGPTPDIMSLKGLRIAFASETDDGCRISPSRVKWLTGNDTLTGRNPHDKYEISFKPTHTLFLSTNHIPHAPSDDYAFWERVLIIPFKVSFVDRKPQGDFERPADPELKKKLREEYSGILAWLVRGCLMAQRDGLNPPTIVTEAVQTKRRDEDWLADFIEECCFVDAAATVGATQLYGVFERWWWKNVSKNAPKQKKFGTLMSKKFKREKQGSYKYFGIGLYDTEYLDDPDD